MKAPREKTSKGHKFKLAVTPTCSCGWIGTQWLSAGARSNAAGEWRAHKEECRA